jgi:hypothetical protein
VPNGSQALVASVRDATGNTGSTSNTVTVQNGPQPLTASVTSPAAGATVSGTSVSVGMAASGGSPAYTYRLSVDGAQLFTTTTSATTATYSWNTTTAGDGSHTLGLTVTGSNGASGTATRTVTVANGSSGTFQVFITDPTPGEIVSGTTWVTIWTQGAAAGAKTYTMTVGSTTVWTQSTSDTPATLPWVTTSTPNGPQTLVVTVRDAANATGTSSVAVTVQNP